MSSAPTPRPTRVVIRRIGISATSAIEARRLADGIGSALERALAGITSGDGAAAPSARRERQAERAARRIADTITARLERRR